MMAARSAHLGFSLIEVMVALVLFGIVASAVAQTVVVSQRGRQISENWMRANALAEDRIEAMRARVIDDPTPDSGNYHPTPTLAGGAAHRRLVRIDVSVIWTDTEDRTLALSTMMRR